MSCFLLLGVFLVGSSLMKKNWHEIISSVIIKDKRKKKTLTDAASMLGRDCCWYDLVAAVRNEKFEGDME